MAKTNHNPYLPIPKTAEQAASTRARPCVHRSSDGAATDADADYTAGDECPKCGCTLGTDGYWYIDRDSAPRKGR